MKSEEEIILRIIKNGSAEQVAELKKEYMELLKSNQAQSQYPTSGL